MRLCCNRSRICRLHFEKVLFTYFVRCDMNDVTIPHSNIVYYVISFRERWYGFRKPQCGDPEHRITLCEIHSIKVDNIDGYIIKFCISTFCFVLSVHLAGSIITPGPCVPRSTGLEVQYEGFTSKLGILMYYVAISNHTGANSTNCKQFVSIQLDKVSCKTCINNVYTLVICCQDEYLNIMYLNVIFIFDKIYKTWIQTCNRVLLNWKDLMT